eukprot:2456790-Pleurochrysis_carterae.AAC.9
MSQYDASVYALPRAGQSSIGSIIFSSAGEPVTYSGKALYWPFQFETLPQETYRHRWTAAVLRLASKCALQVRSLDHPCAQKVCGLTDWQCQKLSAGKRLFEVMICWKRWVHLHVTLLFGGRIP